MVLELASQLTPFPLLPYRELPCRAVGGEACRVWAQEEAYEGQIL